MIKEEYIFEDIKDYLYSNTDLLICGFGTSEERSTFFQSSWIKAYKEILLIKLISPEMAELSYISNERQFSETVDICIEIPNVLKTIGIPNKTVLIDISSLDNVLILFLTQVLLTNVKPRALFAAYIRPETYLGQFDRVQAVSSVPGFSRRESEHQTLCAFLGFEGIRLKSVLETLHSIDRLYPVVAFPSHVPHWYNKTMWNSMEILQGEEYSSHVYKCMSDSVFDAVELLDNTLSMNNNNVLAPLGTRPHSMACAIFASKHHNTRIVYDYVIENNNRTSGIADITIYHLSNFIE